MGDISMILKALRKIYIIDTLSREFRFMKLGLSVVKGYVEKRRKSERDGDDMAWIYLGIKYEVLLVCEFGVDESIHAAVSLHGRLIGCFLTLLRREEESRVEER